MVGNIIFLITFVVFDPSPLTLWINCCFFYIFSCKEGSYVPESLKMKKGFLAMSQKGIISQILQDTG